MVEKGACMCLRQSFFFPLPTQRRQDSTNIKNSPMSNLRGHGALKESFAPKGNPYPPCELLGAECFQNSAS